MDDPSPISPDRESGELSIGQEDYGSDTEEASKKHPPSKKRKTTPVESDHCNERHRSGAMRYLSPETSPSSERPVSGKESNTVRVSRWAEESSPVEETLPHGREVLKVDVVAETPSDQDQCPIEDLTGSRDGQSEPEPKFVNYVEDLPESAETTERNGVRDQEDPQDVELRSRKITDECNSDGEHEVESLPAEMDLPDFKIDMLKGCRSVEEFERVNRINEGTYGVVYKAKDKKTGEIVALKKVKMEKEREGFPMTSLREINILLSIDHPCIVNVKEVVVGSSLDSIFMVMEYVEHDLKRLMETMTHPFSQSEVKYLMFKLIEGIKYLHDNWVLHRDLKTSNILVNNLGELKICDFGLARQYGSPLKTYTSLVVTLWYRAPELLLGCKEYSTAIDMWSLGCIMAELLANKPLFSGKNEMDQVDKIFRTLGTPDELIWPDFPTLRGVKCSFVKQPFSRLREKFPPTAFAGGVTLSNKGFDLLSRLLTYDPKKRITTEEALNHEWFKEFPLPKVPQLSSLKKGRKSP